MKNTGADSLTANSLPGKKPMRSLLPLSRLYLGKLAPPLLTPVLMPLPTLVCLVLSLQSPQSKALQRLQLEGVKLGLQVLPGENKRAVRMPTRSLSLPWGLHRRPNPRVEHPEVRKEPARHSALIESHSLIQMILRMIHSSNRRQLRSP